jgi:hypothetical protein
MCVLCVLCVLCVGVGVGERREGVTCGPGYL